MTHLTVESVLRQLGFFYVERTLTTVRAGHIPTFMIEVLSLDEAGNVAGGPYADLVTRLSTAISFYNEHADEASVGMPEMRQQFIESVVDKAGVPRELLLRVLSQR